MLTIAIIAIIANHLDNYTAVRWFLTKGSDCFETLFPFQGFKRSGNPFPSKRLSLKFAFSHEICEVTVIF